MRGSFVDIDANGNRAEVTATLPDDRPVNEPDISVALFARDVKLDERGWRTLVAEVDKMIDREKATP